MEAYALIQVLGKAVAGPGTTENEIPGDLTHAILLSFNTLHIMHYYFYKIRSSHHPY